MSGRERHGQQDTPRRFSGCGTSNEPGLEVRKIEATRHGQSVEAEGCEAGCNWLVYMQLGRQGT